MSCKKPIAWAVATSAMMAVSSISYGQQDTGRTGTTAQPAPAGQAGGAGGAGAAGGAASGAGAAAQGMQVDQQLMQQYQQMASEPQTAPAKLFLLETALHNQAEIELSRLASQKSQNQQVKQIAQKMVEDHQKMAQQMQPVAQKLGVQPPQGLPSLKQQEQRVMSALEGEQFDKKYISHLHMAHARDVASFQAASQMDQSEVKQFAAQTLPVLQQHKQHVMQTAMTMKVIGQDANEAQPAGARIPGRSGGDTPATETPRPGSGGAGSSGSGTGSGTGGTGSGTGSGTGGSGTGGSGTGGTGGSTPR